MDRDSLAAAEVIPELTMAEALFSPCIPLELIGAESQPPDIGHL
jgi:hypothetical protein